jgi:branched-chain amino acid transport system substrate-binding protein
MGRTGCVVRAAYRVFRNSGREMHTTQYAPLSLAVALCMLAVAPCVPDTSARPNTEHRTPNTGERVIGIGLLVPAKGLYREEGEEVRRGVEMAVAEANAAAPTHPPAARVPGRAGYPHSGWRRRFALMVRPDDGLWGTGVRQTVRLAFDDRVCALIGGIDSASAHLIEQVAQKARLTHVIPWASDRTLTQAGVPWVFRCAPNDRRIAARLVRRLFVQRGYRKVGVIFAAERSARLSAGEFLRAAGKAGYPIPDRPGTHGRWVWPLPVGENGLTPAALPGLIDATGSEKPQAVVLFAPAAIRAPVLAALRRPPPTSDGPGTRGAAGARSAGAGTPVFLPDDGAPVSPSFQRRYRARYGRTATAAAICGYDSACVILRAVERFPANKPPGHQALRDAIARLQFQGQTGAIRFDKRGDRI